MNIFKKILVGIVACLLAGGLYACSSEKGDKKNEEKSSQATEPISCAYLNKSGYETIIMADKKSYLAEAPFEISLSVVTGSGQQSVEALLAGTVDIAAAGQGPVADAMGQYGNDIVLLGGSNCSTDSQVVIAGPVMKGDASLVPYNKEKDNKEEVKASFSAAAKALGHPIRIGVQQGATTEPSLKSWLEKMGVTYNDFAVEGEGVVSLIDSKANLLPTVLASGNDIEMMAASQPYPDTALANIAGSYRVGSNADTNSYDVDMYITTKEVYEKKSESIKEFMRAMKKANDYMSNTSNGEECVEICSNSMGAPRDSEESVFKRAQWKTEFSDRMIDSLYKTIQKKGYAITREDITAACPLMEWYKELNA